MQGLGVSYLYLSLSIYCHCQGVIILSLFLDKNFKYLHVITVLTGGILISGLTYGLHAEERMAERGVTKKEVGEALQRGAKTFQLPNKTLYVYRHFIVVTKKVHNRVFIITVKPRW